jgi:twitching motility protein PilT
MRLEDIVNFAVENKASDIHIMSGYAPHVRSKGSIKKLKTEALTKDDVTKIVASTVSPEMMEQFQRDLELDYSISLGQNRYRMHAWHTINGPGISMRTIPTVVRTLAELNIPKAAEKFATLHKGIVLVTGPTGSGKSTTLAAIINHINCNYPKHIVTIEDPIEFQYQSQMSLISQREVGRSTKSFYNALRAALREDPDVIMVGELRDVETIKLALSAAETGHLVLGTLHTNSAPKTIDRIVDVFPAADKPSVQAALSSSIQGVISQRLMKRADGSGMVGAYEVMLATPAIRNLIRENKIPQIESVMQINSSKGMVLMKDYQQHLFEQGIIDASELIEDDEGGGHGGHGAAAPKPASGGHSAQESHSNEKQAWKETSQKSDF